MLTLLKIRNVALIESVEIEFGPGLNLLTGETGSGKSIIVDSLGALTGERVSSDLIKEGEQSAQIEGLFSVSDLHGLGAIFEENGIDTGDVDEAELIIRRDLSLTGKNRIFVNDRLVTQGFLKRVGPLLVDIHGQGEQASLFDPASHLEMLDRFADSASLRTKAAEAYRKWSQTKAELAALQEDEADKLQLVDILKFQSNEIRNANLKPGEPEELEEEKRRLNNVEKLSTLSEEVYALLYENDESTVATLEKAARKINELCDYESRFREYTESLQTAQAVLEDLAITSRDFRNQLEFSPERLEEIENRLAEISRLTRKYGGSVDSVLAHLEDAESRLENFETAEFREAELRRRMRVERTEYVAAARELHGLRIKASKKLESAVETNLRSVALEKARFEIGIEAPANSDLNDENFERGFSAKGFDSVEFFFSANVGESPKPLARVASGGEASRLMLILKTTARNNEAQKTAVFDEIDVGIGGRVAEAVGLRLKELSSTQQVLCVTHQPQIASLADRHYLVSKDAARGRTLIGIAELDEDERVEELGRMLAGEKITEAARANAREMLRAARDRSSPSGKARKVRVK